MKEYLHKHPISRPYLSRKHTFLSNPFPFLIEDEAAPEIQLFFLYKVSLHFFQDVDQDDLIVCTQLLTLKIQIRLRQFPSSHRSQLIFSLAAIHDLTNVLIKHLPDVLFPLVVLLMAFHPLRKLFPTQRKLNQFVSSRNYRLVILTSLARDLIVNKNVLQSSAWQYEQVLVVFPVFLD